MLSDQTPRRHAELERARENLAAELATATGDARAALEERLRKLDDELRDLLLDHHNRSSMDAGSEA